MSSWITRSRSRGLCVMWLAACATAWLVASFATPVAWAAESASPGASAVMRAILTHPVLVLFLVVALGLLVGRVTVAGMSLGSSGVLFTALLAGHLGLAVPEVGDLGLVLFVYCIGIMAGPSFFRALGRQGKTLSILALVIVGSGAATTWVMARLLDVPGDLAGGIFAGALTSTPALAAAIEALGPEGPRASVGYGLAYPIGVVGTVLFIQLLPRLLRQDLQQLADASRLDHRGDEVVRTLIEITNPALVGRKVRDVPTFDAVKCRIVRRLDGPRLVPLNPDFTFQLGEIVLVISRARRVPAIVDLMGKVSDRPYLLDAENERRSVVVTSRSFIGRSIRDLDPLVNYGVELSRFTRLGLSFVPPGDTKFQSGDVLTAVGPPENLRKFAAAAGDRTDVVDHSDLISLTVGITLGVLIGLIPVSVFGGPAMKLGLSGGPLLVGLLLGHFGRVGPFIGYLPRASRLAVSELGLMLFLAEAGVTAGADIVSVVQTHGVKLLAVTAVVLLVPMTLGYVVARKLLGMPLLSAIGGICGGMTSTPALGAITAKTDSDTPIVAYAAAYPVALILMTIFAQALILMLAP